MPRRIAGNDVHATAVHLVDPIEQDLLPDDDSQPRDSRARDVLTHRRHRSLLPLSPSGGRRCLHPVNPRPLRRPRQPTHRAPASHQGTPAAQETTLGGQGLREEQSRLLS